MAYVLSYQCQVYWIGDGVGPNSVPAAQVLAFGNSGIFYPPATQANPPNPLSSGFIGTQVIPGGDSPTGGNMTTAATAMGTDVSNTLNTAAILLRIQNFSSGGG